jgi:hypothetical protein
MMAHTRLSAFLDRGIVRRTAQNASVAASARSVASSRALTSAVHVCSASGSRIAKRRSSQLDRFQVTSFFGIFPNRGDAQDGANKKFQGDWGLGASL